MHNCEFGLLFLYVIYTPFWGTMGLPEDQMEQQIGLVTFYVLFRSSVGLKSLEVTPFSWSHQCVCGSLKIVRAPKKLVVLLLICWRLWTFKRSCMFWQSQISREVYMIEGSMSKNVIKPLSLTHFENRHIGLTFGSKSSWKVQVCRTLQCVIVRIVWGTEFQ